MNGGKPCVGNDTETASSCLTPCPGWDAVKLNLTSIILKLPRLNQTCKFRHQAIITYSRAEGFSALVIHPKEVFSSVGKL